MAQNALINYECKGNVRELEKIIRRAIIMAEDPYIQSVDLHLQMDSTALKQIEDEAEDFLNLAVARSIAKK